jgi:prepilin-type N-terminal cleavage/methylation domain-containing protein
VGLIRRRPLTGFSLVEVLVALVMGAIVMSVTMGVLSQMIAHQGMVRARNELTQQGAFTSQLLKRDIRQAGFGVSLGASMDGLTPHYAPLLVGAADEIGLVADLPRPHAQLATFGTLHDRDPLDRSHVVFHNENNGTCVPEELGTGCDPANTSLFFPGMVGNKCETATGFTSRYCPWSLRRLEPGDYFQIVAGNGDWANAQVSTSATPTLAQLPTSVAGNAWYLPLEAPYATFVASPTSRPYALPGHAWVTTLDRVFYDYDAGTRTFRRMQCWGSPDPGSTSWPIDTATAIPANPAAAVGTTGGCTPWERLLTDVQSVSFSYFDSSGTAVTPNTGANKLSVVRVDYTILLRRATRMRNVEHWIIGTAYLRSEL